MAPSYQLEPYRQVAPYRLTAEDAIPYGGVARPSSQQLAIPNSQQYGHGGALRQQLQQPPPAYHQHHQHHQQPQPGYSNQAHSYQQQNSFLQNHHERQRAHENLEPISPYPELKNLTGPLHMARHADPTIHGDGHGQNSGFATTSSYYHSDHRKLVGLPEFPFHHWKDDPREHEYRPTYEQLLYAEYEKRKEMGLHAAPRHDDLGLAQNAYSDLDAVENARLHGTLQSMAGDVHGRLHSAHQMIGNIERLVQTYRAETEKRRAVLEQYKQAYGENDPHTSKTFEAVQQAEAMTYGASTVLQAVQTAPIDQEAQQMSSMAVVVRQFGQVYGEKQAEWTQLITHHGEHADPTRFAHGEALRAEWQWNGARAAQQAATEQNIQAMETPQAIADREREGAMIYRAEAEDLKAKVSHLEKQYGDPKDQRVVMAKQQLEEAELKAKEAEDRARKAQAVADGRPATEGTLGRPKSRTRSRERDGSLCVVQ